jgi:hypothetical protein
MSLHHKAAHKHNSNKNKQEKPHTTTKNHIVMYVGIVRKLAIDSSDLYRYHL